MHHTLELLTPDLILDARDSVGLRSGGRPTARPWIPIWRPLVLVASLVMAAGCQSQGAPPGQSQPTKANITPATQVSVDLQAETILLDRIKADIAGAACDSDTQCRTLAVGERSCGGPQVWLAWSSQKTDETQLRKKAEQLAALQRLRYTRSGEMSTCQVIPDPGAGCQARRCELRRTSTAN